MHLEELDLAIPDMDTALAEERIKHTLELLRGVETVRLIERGAFVRHDADQVTGAEICTAIRQSGYRPSIFQDSHGRMGKSSQ
jgi:cation transport ATPase